MAVQCGPPTTGIAGVEGVAPLDGDGWTGTAATVGGAVMVDAGGGSARRRRGGTAVHQRERCIVDN
jgi:hypothetical protein